MGGVDDYSIGGRNQGGVGAGAVAVVSRAQIGGRRFLEMRRRVLQETAGPPDFQVGIDTGGRSV